MMQILADGSSSTPWFAAGWTMLHYLWIGGLVGLLAVVLRRMTIAWGAERRYWLALSLLAVLAVTPVGLFAWCVSRAPGEVAGASALREIELYAPPAEEFAESRTAEDAVSGAAESDVPVASTEWPTTARIADDRRASPAATIIDDTPREARTWTLIGWLPWLWIIGTPATLLLLATGCLGAARLRRMARPLDDDVAETCRRLAESLGVVRPVMVAVCDRVAAPILVGILRPMILLPPAALSGWTPQEVEMALLHELAHIRRWDNLVNFLQRIIEAVLFYQPAVWLVSDWARREREHACDELVVKRTGRTRDYATLLARLAAEQAGTPHLLDGLVSSSMARSQLATRIRYLMHREYEPMQISAKLWTMAGVLLLVLLGIVSWQQFSNRSAAVAGDEPEDAAGANEPREEDGEGEEPPSASPPIAKELLRYDGKSFAQWSTEWRTELKPGRRQEAIEAFRVFAVNGFGPEAAETIVQVMRNYDTWTIDGSPEGKLKSAALAAVGDIPAEDALPALANELRHGTTRGRLFVLMSLNRSHAPREALPAVLKAVEDESPRVRALAVNVLGKLAEQPEKVSDVLLESMKDEDAMVRTAAVQTANALKLRSAPYVAAYRAALKDGNAEVAGAALNALAPRGTSAGFGSAEFDGFDEAFGDDGGFDDGGGFGAEDGGFGGFDGGGSRRISGVYVPEMVDALQHPDDRLWRRTADTLGVLGEKARQAVPPLVKLSCEGKPHLQQRATYALSQLCRDSLDKLIADEIAKAIKAEEGEHQLAALQLLANFQQRLGAHGTRTIPAVSALLEDKDERVREAAKQILGRYGR